MASRPRSPVGWFVVLGLVLGFAGCGVLHLALESHGPDDLSEGSSSDCAVCQASHYTLGEAPQEPPTAVLASAPGWSPLRIEASSSCEDSLPAPPRAPPVLS